MKRIIGGLATVATLLAATAALAATSGTYRGASVLHLDGQTATHPFSLTVRSGKITRANFLAGSDCEFLDEKTGVPADITISGNRFAGTIRLHGGADLHLIGRFSGSRVSGTFTGATSKAANCTIPRNSFSAKRG